MNICTTFNCPYWSEGQRTESGARGGYGCQKYSVSNLCLVANVQGVVPNQYDLHVPDGSMSGNKRTLIKLAIAELSKPDQD